MNKFHNSTDIISATKFIRLVIVVWLVNVIMTGLLTTIFIPNLESPGVLVGILILGGFYLIIPLTLIARLYCSLTAGITELLNKIRVNHL